jgi:periplasmic glucans biosynthesis protein
MRLAYPRLLASLVAVAAVALTATGAWAFGLDDVAARAEKLAAAAYAKPAANLPKTVKALGYDQYRDVRFRAERALWRGTDQPFELMFFHRGWLFEDAVKIHEIAPDGVREIGFDPEAFDYGKNKVERADVNGLGFAGFRVHAPINSPGYRDEIVTFLGASYFRALGRGQRYGLSARGLAIDTAESGGEEFPRFVEFWIERPKVGAKQLTIYGLLDSPRATGAYRFIVKPGVTTVLDVDARLFLRRNVGKLALAPLTSMFYFGPNQRSAREDYRPAVHDSAGLSIQTSSAEWIWRPLVNPKRLLVTSFATTDPAGFGLMQRDRAFASYQDLEARYDLRPSAWVEPKGSWGPGRIELVQLPVPNETNDNIVAYWVPDRQPKPNQAFAYGYRVHWQKDRETRPPVGWVRETRRGRGWVTADDGTIQLHVDFEGAPLTRLPPNADVNAALWIDGNGEIVEHQIRRNDAAGGWRSVIRFRPKDRSKPVEVRAHLMHDNKVVSETWSYVLQPD